MFVGSRCRTVEARGDSTGAVLGHGCIRLYATLGENIETSWITFAWRLGSRVHSQCPLAVVQNCFMPVEIPQVQFSVKVCISSYATLEENIETGWTTFAWRLALSVFTVKVRGLLCRTASCQW